MIDHDSQSPQHGALSRYTGNVLLVEGGGVVITLIGQLNIVSTLQHGSLGLAQTGTLKGLPEFHPLITCVCVALDIFETSQITEVVIADNKIHHTWRQGSDPSPHKTHTAH